MISNVLLSVELNYCWFNFAKQQQLCTCTTCRHCTTSTWKCLINGGRKQLTRNFFFSFWTWICFSGIRLLHLTKSASWNNLEKNWKIPNSNFYEKWSLHRYPLKLPVTVQDVSIVKVLNSRTKPLSEFPLSLSPLCSTSLNYKPCVKKIISSTSAVLVQAAAMLFQTNSCLGPVWGKSFGTERIWD